MKKEIGKKLKENPKYNIPDNEKYFIIGKPVNKEKAERLGIKDKAGKGEVLIEVPKKLIDNMRK